MTKISSVLHWCQLPPNRYIYAKYVAILINRTVQTRWIISGPVKQLKLPRIYPHNLFHWQPGPIHCAPDVELVAVYIPNVFLVFI